MKTLIKFSAVVLLAISAFSCSEPVTVAPSQTSAAQHNYQTPGAATNPQTTQAAL